MKTRTGLTLGLVGSALILGASGCGSFRNRREIPPAPPTIRNEQQQMQRPQVGFGSDPSPVPSGAVLNQAPISSAVPGAGYGGAPSFGGGAPSGGNEATSAPLGGMPAGMPSGGAAPLGGGAGAPLGDAPQP